MKDEKSGSRGESGAGAPILLILGSSYFAQGLPAGLYGGMLPVLLRQEGVSLAGVGASSLVALPWALKFFCAPWIDHLCTSRFGGRRAWLLPLQVGGALVLALSALAPGANWVTAMIAGGALMNVVFAIQDAAADALATDILDERQRGVGNAVQLGGHKLGMIVGGGLMLAMHRWLGYAGTMLFVASIMLFATLPLLGLTEPRRATSPPRRPYDSISTFFRRPHALGWLLLLASYRAGSAVGGRLVEPWLVDAGWSSEAIGLVSGTLAVLAGLGGAAAGGVLLDRLPRRTCLAGFAGLHAVVFVLLAVAAAARAAPALLAPVLLLERATGSMATVALLAAIMDACRPACSATDYALQSSSDKLSTTVLGAAGGLFGATVGYPLHFLTAAALIASAAAFAAARHGPLMRGMAGSDASRLGADPDAAPRPQASGAGLPPP